MVANTAVLKTNPGSCFARAEGGCRALGDPTRLCGAPGAAIPQAPRGPLWARCPHGAAGGVCLLEHEAAPSPSERVVLQASDVEF